MSSNVSQAPAVGHTQPIWMCCTCTGSTSYALQDTWDMMYVAYTMMAWTDGSTSIVFLICTSPISLVTVTGTVSQTAMQVTATPRK